jgi:hypothetical protein
MTSNPFRPREKGQTIIYKKLHIQLKIDQNKPHLKLGMNSSAPEGLAIPVAKPAVLMFESHLGQTNNYKIY